MLVPFSSYCVPIRAGLLSLHCESEPVPNRSTIPEPRVSHYAYYAHGIHAPVVIRDVLSSHFASPTPFVSTVIRIQLSS